MPFLETGDRTQIHYETSGHGQPLVFIHGWAMSGVVWQFQQQLADRYRIITMDLRGHGQSSLPATLTLEDFAADVAALFKHLDLTDAVLIGWSMGAQVSLQAFQAVRPRLAAMVLVGATARFSTTTGYSHGLPPLEVKGLAVRLKRDYQKTMGDFFRSMFAAGEPEREQYQRIVHEVVMKGRSPQPGAARQALQVLADADLRPLLAGVDRPVLLIHGSEDAICPVAAATYLAGELPMARLHIINGSGHAPFMADPAHFNALLQSFIRNINGRD